MSEEDTKFQWSKERALNGEPFLIGKNGSIDLVIIPNEVLAKIGLEKVPFRLTPSMIAHVYERHKKELKLHSKADAVEAILDVMNNFDHVRMGERDNTFVFSIEGNRTASARRAITFVLEYDRGKWIGIKTVGYDRVSDIKELTTLWEKGEKTSATGVATANVTSEQPLQGDRADGIASNQSAVISTHKDTPSNQDSQDNKHENKEALSEDTVGGSPVALAYLLEGGVGSILNAGYFLHGVAAAYPPITNDIERIRASHGGLLGLPPLEFVENHPEVVEEIEKIILETYGQKGVEIYHKLCQNASGFYPRQGFEVGRDIESLEALQPHPETTEPTESERTQAPAKESAPKSEGSKQKSEKKGKTASKPKSEVKSEVKSDEEATLTEDKFEEAMNTNDIDKVTDALKLTRNAIELNSIDDIQEGDIVLVTRPDIELLTNKSNTAGTYIYEAKQRLSNSYMLEDIYADGDIALTDQNIQEMKGRSKNASYTIYRAKPQSATKDSPTSRKHKAEAEAQTATTEDTALLDAVADIMQQSGLEVFVDEKAQQVLDEVNGKNLTKGLRLAIEDTKNGTDSAPTAISKNADLSRGSETNSISDAKVDNRIEVSNENAENLNKLAQTIQKNGALKPENFLLALESQMGSTNENPDSSQYFKNEHDYTLRLANHRSNARMFLLHDHATGNTSVVVKMNERKHRKDKRVEAVEFVYFPDKLNKETQLSIIEGIQNWIKTGEYNQIAHRTNVSTIPNNLREYRFFRTPDGEAYGFTVNGKIYLDPRIATAETAIHEYAHLWADMLRQMNPEAWNDIVQLMKGTSVWDEVKSLYPELKTDDEIADEVLAHYSGRQGAAKLREEHHRIAHDQNMDLRSKATAIAALERIKQALTKFWKGVADLLHIRFTTAEEVADRVLADLLHGVNPTAYAKREDGKVRKMGTRVNRYMANIASHFNEAELTPSQQAVVDVYSGKSDNQAISVEREDGKRKVVMRQGNENHAGAKHSLYRHFSRNEGTITADDILLIPQVLEKGEMKIVKNGKGKLYSLEKDGVKYKVYTEKKDSQEIFCDFYTNKKGNNTRPYISERDAQNGNTQLSARAGRIVANDAANVAQSSDTSNSNTPESTDIDHILGNGNSKQGEKVRQHMETIAQKLGLKLNWVSSNKQSNGFYDPQTKTITIAADAENPLAAVFGHETVHRLKEMNAEAFNSLVALAKEILGSSFDAEVAKIESRYRKAGMNYDTAYYEEEAVCDFVGDMIDNQNLLERICWDANHKVLSALRNIFDKILAAIGIKDARLMHIRTVISAAYEQSVRNDESSKLTTGNEVKRDSLKRKDEVDEKSSGYFKKHPDAMSESVFAQAQKDMDDIAEWMNPYYDATAMGNRLLPEEQYGRKGAASTIFANGSYGKTMENTLKCIRTLAYNQFTDDVKKQLGRPLTQKESFLASQMVYDIATDPQCLYCYVSLDRKAYDDFLLKYVQQKEDVLDKFRSLPQDEKSAAAKGAPHTALKELYAEFLANRKDTKNMQARFNMWIRNEMAGNRSVKASDLITAETRRAILDGLDTSLAREVRDAEKYAQGASWAKKDVDYISYVGELLKLSPAWIKKLTGEYGLRFYSFSEYTPAFILENMQMVRDASLRGLNGLGYTKELDFVKIFAPTGMNINCSVYGRMDNEGNMHMDTLQGADWEEVKQLRSKYNNVGAVFVATNDASVDWALNQDWIDVIIPFHIVRTGADIAAFYGWDNHMRDQSDHFADSSKTMYVSPVEHQNDKEKFLEACKKHGLIPRFEKWMNHPNYMRLVNETRLSVNETRPIKPIFDMTEAKDSWDRFVNRGGYYNGWWQVSPEEYANNVRTVVEDIRSGKMANEVEYGRQDMPANPERMIAAARKKRIHGNVPLVDVFDRSGNVLGRKAESSNGAVLYREDSENSNHPYEVFTGNEAIERLNAFFDIRPRDLPTLLAPINSLDAFKELFANPVRTVLGTLIKVKDGVFNKMARKEREKIAGAVLPTLQDADFVIKDIDGSYLYVKRYKNAENEHIYNVVVVNKHDEVEEYISSVHIKSNNNLRNKIEKGAELLIPSKRTRYGVQAPSNSTPAANIAQNPDTANTPQREDAESPATEAQITEAANRTAGSLHLDNVTILSEEDLARLTPKQQRAKGWFDPKTGRIYINASNHANEADVVQTVLHEAVAHFGLRALFGKDFDTMLDRVYRAAGSEIHIPAHPHRVQQPGTANNRLLRQTHLRPQCQGRKTH